MVMKKKMLVVTVILVSGIITLFTGFQEFSCIKKQQTMEIQYVVYTVEKDDTLWDIACEFDNINSDIRDVVYSIRKTNDLKTSTIHPEQRLLIPIYVDALKDENYRYVDNLN
jgi:hypothetical protein